MGISAIIGLADRISGTDPLIIKFVSSIVTVESRYDAFFRYMGGKVPNPAPFETGISSIWAYNLALSFVVPGSCPIEIPIPILPSLSVSSLPANTSSANTSSANTTGTPLCGAPYQNTTGMPLCSAPYKNTTGTPLGGAPYGNTTGMPLGGAPYGNTTSPFGDANTTVRPMQVEFTWDPTQMPFLVEQGKPLFIGWINQQNVPAYTKLSITGHGQGIADVPQEANGVAFAAVTSQLPDNANDLALATLAGPVVLTIS